MNTEQTFQTSQLSTAAAILAASDDIQLVKVTDGIIDHKKVIHLSPKDKAEKYYLQLINGSLMINAAQNSLYIIKLKQEIFGNYQRNDQRSNNNDRY